MYEISNDSRYSYFSLSTESDGGKRKAESNVQQKRRFESINNDRKRTRKTIPERRIDFWSLDLFRFTHGRILDGQKFISPSAVLGRERDLVGLQSEEGTGEQSQDTRYNYSFFNNESPERIQVFDHRCSSSSSLSSTLGHCITPLTSSMTSSSPQVPAIIHRPSLPPPPIPSNLPPPVPQGPSASSSVTAPLTLDQNTRPQNRFFSPSHSVQHHSLPPVPIRSSHSPHGLGPLCPPFSSSPLPPPVSAFSSFPPPPPPPPPPPSTVTAIPLSSTSSSSCLPAITSKDQPTSQHCLLPRHQPIRPPAPPVAVQPPGAAGISRLVFVGDIINRSVDSRHVIIVRGLPGSGKTTFCQAFKEKELVNNRSAPRILSLDQFYQKEEDEDRDRNKDKEREEEREECERSIYRRELFKLFKRQVDEGFFSVILLDSVHDKVLHFLPFYQYARLHRFQVSVLDIKVSPEICAKRCENRFSPEQIFKMAREWEETPNCYDRLNADSLIQEISIEDVEMAVQDERSKDDDEDGDNLSVVSHSLKTSSTTIRSRNNYQKKDECAQEDEEDDDDDNFISETGFFKSKWDEDFEDTKERLDGMKQSQQQHHDERHRSLSIRDFLGMEMESANLNRTKTSQNDQKTKVKQVKWADFEELKKQKRRRELGFVAGNTDWAKLMSSDMDVAEAALVQVRLFVKDGAE